MKGVEPTFVRENSPSSLIAGHASNPAAEGLTGADLKRVVEDGKALFAYDKAREVDLRPAEQYFAAAVATVRDNKRLYEEAEARARERRRNRR